MNIQLIQGEFSSNEALELIVKMISVKIKYHEDKINSLSTEEDVITREAKIKRLQKELFELRKTIHSKTKTIKVEAQIKIE